VNLWLKSLILAAALLAFGAARLPYEAGLSRDLRRAGLVPPRLEIDSRDRIGQTSSAVALGGLRTLVATFLNLRAYTAFSDRRWGDVATTFDTIVDLAPHTRYYWETGSWHLAYNAAGFYLNDSDLPPLRRRELWRSFISQGRAFLERGIRNNPDDWSLYASLGFLLSDPNKFPSFRASNKPFAAAAEAYRKSTATGKAPGFVQRAWCYSLARVPGREAEALALAKALYAQGPKHRTPTLMMLLLVLEAHENPSLDVAQQAIGLFGSPEKAYAALSGHWQRTRDRFPVFGVSAALLALEKSLSIPAEQSILGKTLPPPPNPDDWFQP
jgi:hypothetical protein